MLKYSTRNADKGVFVGLPHNLSILQELNHGPIWVQLADKTDALLYGADLNAWMGDGSCNLYLQVDGQDSAVPSSTRFAGYYQRERRSVPNPKGYNVAVGPKTGNFPEARIARPRNPVG